MTVHLLQAQARTLLAVYGTLGGQLAVLQLKHPTPPLCKILSCFFVVVVVVVVVFVVGVSLLKESRFALSYNLRCPFVIVSRECRNQCEG